MRGFQGGFGLGAATTRGRGLGPEKIINGDCSSPTGWNLGAGVAITGGKLVFTAATGTATNNGTEVGEMVEGATYRCAYTIDSISLGSVAVNIADTFGTPRNAPGTYTEDLVASGLDGDGWYLQGVAGVATASMDDFSVKQVV